MKVALIGSFRQERYNLVVKSIKDFSSANYEVVSPAGTKIISDGNFVRFESDVSSWSDEHIQSVTLRNIFSADFVYVVVNDVGHVGFTTCYEIGRIVQRRQPIYFMRRPHDLPVHIPDWSVATAGELVIRFESGAKPCWLYQTGVGENFDVERSLTC